MYIYIYISIKVLFINPFVLFKRCFTTWPHACVFCFTCERSQLEFSVGDTRSGGDKRLWMLTLLPTVIPHLFFYRRITLWCLRCTVTMELSNKGTRCYVQNFSGSMNLE